MKNKKIVLLGGNRISTNIVYNAIDSKFGIYTTIIEEHESLKEFLVRRIKKLGFITVLGQILFRAFIVNYLNIISAKRKLEISTLNNLDSSKIPANKIINVKSVNSEQVSRILKNINPDLIIINGTRIISNKILKSVNCQFINIHAGMTPKYRGVHGAYWAFVNNDLENAGVTIHFVNNGIDTGDIIFQKRILPSKSDNFVTYPYLQISAGIKILEIAIENYFNDRINSHSFSIKGVLYYQPTIWEYLYHRFLRKIK